MTTISPETFMYHGCKYTGALRGYSDVMKLRRFKAHFGTSPLVCSIMWSMISTEVPSGASFLHLLWGLLFLKVYATESVLCGIVGGVDEKTFRKWAWLMVEKMAGLKTRIVSVVAIFVLFNFKIQLVYSPSIDPDEQQTDESKW